MMFFDGYIGAPPTSIVISREGGKRSAIAGKAHGGGKRRVANRKHAISPTNLVPPSAGKRRALAPVTAT
jgi:hypothetical protein